MAFPQLTETFGTDQPLDDYAAWVALSASPPGSSVSPFVTGGTCLPEGDVSSERFKDSTAIYQTAVSTPTQCAKFKIDLLNNDSSSVGVILRQASADGTGACYHFVLSKTATNGVFDILWARVTGLTYGETIETDTGGLTLSDGDWVGFAVEGTGNDTVVTYWDFGAADPGDYSTWGAPTATMTTNPPTPIDSGAYVGVRFYVANSTTEPHQGMSSWAGGDTAAADGVDNIPNILMHLAKMRRAS